MEFPAPFDQTETLQAVVNYFDQATDALSMARRLDHFYKVLAPGVALEDWQDSAPTSFLSFHHHYKDMIGTLTSEDFATLTHLDNATAVDAYLKSMRGKVNILAAPGRSRLGSGGVAFGGFACSTSL